MQKTVVVNKRRANNSPDAVYVGRGTPFGNPYVIGTHGDRAQVIERFRAHFHRKLRQYPSFRKRVEALRGKTLVCHCKPLACHADVIKEWLDGLPPAAAPVGAKPRPSTPQGGACAVS